MKINVSVDLSELYSEGDEISMSSEIKSFVADEVKRRVSEDFMKKVDEMYYEKLRGLISEAKETIILDRFKFLVSENKVKSSSYQKEPISVNEWLNEELRKMIVNDSSLKQKLDAMVTKTVESITKQIKDRYDMLFATQLITKMNEVNLLNVDAAKMLLTENKEP